MSLDNFTPGFNVAKTRDILGVCFWYGLWIVGWGALLKFHSGNQYHSDKETLGSFLPGSGVVIFFQEYIF